MTKILLFFFTVCSIQTYLSQNYWVQKDSVNGPPKSACGSFVLKKRGYILGGIDIIGFKRKMYSYKASSDDWDDEISIGGAEGDGLERASASTFSIEKKGYILLGQNQTSAYLKDMWEYDSETDSWSQKANFIGTPRKQAVSFAWNQKGYVGTGQDASGLKNDFFSYNPLTNTWVQIADFPGSARRLAVGFAMGDFAFVGTGDDGVLKNDFYRYNPVTDSWSQQANFPGTPRSGATGWGIFPCAYIATGEDNTNTYKKDVWEYNYYGNSWVQRADLIGPGRKNAVSFVLENVAYLGTGYNGMFLDDFYAYYGTVGLTPKKVPVSATIFPNPASDYVIIQADESFLQNCALTFSTAQGQKLNAQIDAEEPGKLTINVSNLHNGVYIYSLVNQQTGSYSVGKLNVLH